MRIVHFLWGLANGGAENLAVDLANVQSGNHEVILLVANDRVEDSVKARISPAVRLVALGRPEGSRNPYWAARLLTSLHSLKPDVIHSHADNLANLGQFIAAPMILTVHDTNIKISAASKRFSAVCCISRAVLNDVSHRYPGLKVVQVNNGVLTEDIVAAQRRPSALLRGVQVSRLVHEKKGQDILINALAIVNSDHDGPKLSVDFIGDGPSMAYLHELANTCGVADHCRFLGAMSRNKVYHNLCQYDLLIQPSRYEGFGLTVAEGMAAGIAVLVSDIQGPMEIISEGQFGHFFKTNDVDSLARSLKEVIFSITKGEEDALLLAAIKHVKTKYDLRQTAGAYLKVYEEACRV